MSTAAQLARIQALLKITNLPLKGDGRDGSVKYCLLDADDKDLVIGNNYNDPLYGFTDAEFPELVILSINALPALLRERDRLRIALADSIRRPMGVIPDSAEGLLRDGDLDLAEARRVNGQEAQS